MYKEIRNGLVVVFGAALIAAGFNFFLVPHQLLSGGVSGVSMLVNYVTPINLSILYFSFNIPLLIAGLFLLGRRFIMLSILSVVSVTWFLAIFPKDSIATDPILSAVFGGVLVGLGTGISFRVGGSSGGFDILGSIVTRYRDFPIGNILVGLNAVVILAMGYTNQNWNLVLASILSLYITGKVLDFIHVGHIKVTVYIITNEAQAMLERLLTHPRGVTLIKTEGAFSHKEKDMLMTVTTMYERAELREIIKQTDSSAFVNIVETVGVMGSFRRR